MIRTLNPEEQSVSTIIAKDGLLYRDGKPIPLPEADRIARSNGYAHAEQMVRALESISMEVIQSACSNLRKVHDNAISLVDEYEAEKLALEKKYTGRLALAAQRIKERHGELSNLLTHSSPLFTDPKTQTFFGIRVGWMKAKGTISFTDEATVIARAEDLLTKPKAATVIKTTKKLDKKGLAKLAADVLRKLGVTLTADTDVPFIKPVEGDAVKKLNALLKGSDEGEEHERVQP